MNDTCCTSITGIYHAVSDHHTVYMINNSQIYVTLKIYIV